MNLGLSRKEIENDRVFNIIETESSFMIEIKGRMRIYELIIAAKIMDNRIKRIIIPTLLERTSS